jgi:pyruvate,orthophosphate dikinase
VFSLDHRHGLPAAQIRRLIGSKAANLAVMAGELHLPVPPGFVISTRACMAYLDQGWPDGLDEQILEQVRRLEAGTGRRFGAGPDPLLVSVRSGAAVSMPGMMDTILNLGLTDETTAALAAATGDDHFAEDCRARFDALYRKVVGTDSLPQDPWAQLRAAVRAVFRSWNSERARAYRLVEGIPDELGTAVTVQAMVFGNRGTDSATGVLFTRNPATGEPEPFGDVLLGAQGEDVVAGTHHTEPVRVLASWLPEVAGQLARYAALLERHFRDLCDIEFTIERGRLWLLQVRTGKRSPQAALRIAVDMASDPAFPLSRAEAVERVAAHLRRPPQAWVGRPAGLAPVTRGLPASPGLAWGGVVTSPAAAATARSQGPFLLVRPDTSPEDVPAMAQAAGVLTSRGGVASHAAVVARGWGIPAVVGAAAVTVEADRIVVGDRAFGAGEILTINGGTGEVFAGRVPGELVPAPEAVVLRGWAEELGITLDEPAAGTVPGGAEAADPVPAAQVSPDDVLQALSIKGVAPPDALAAASDTTTERASHLLDQLLGDGLVKLVTGAATLTAAGQQRCAALLATDQERWSLAEAGAALDAFVPLDRRVKEVTTAWQVRRVGGQETLNDHGDAGYDAAVLDRLAAVHEDATAWLRPLVGRVPRLGRYLLRLDRAWAALRSGDHRFLASPRVDSYHSIWFELHEDLIKLAGRTREDEAAAGRA